MINPCQSFEASLCIPSFYVLGSVADLVLRNINYIHFESQLTINNSLTIDNSSQDQVDPWHSVPPSAKIITIGSNASLTSNSNFPLDLTSLTTLGDTLSVINNTNCSLNFDALTRARALVLLDNVNTTLPAFPALERVSDVHLRGNIITSSGPNIFPSLKFAPGAVIVEAWNDFNCSKLVSQQREGIINSLICHGTNNGTDDGTGNMTANGATGPVSSGSSLSAGAWAGIAVGIAIAVLGGSAVTWLILRFRRNLNNLRKQMERNVQDSSEKSPKLPPEEGLDRLHEIEAQRITRELHDEHIGEMEVRPNEMPDDHIREVQSIPQELPGDSLVQDITSHLAEIRDEEA
ncbi:hypothetical protein EKO27_g7582 [Xylaria grammica]|uniref:Receptor L-domain domain-containing protein n=1 Tax=Xylaria grammica TaxID=363999 RepID=A0A439CZ85_9PEZI|nr:hypothetical protein EKO27_g7582 [Xylaria grammica]